MITPETPAEEAGETNTITIYASQAAIGESVPAVGDAIDLSRASGTVTAVHGDKITVRIDTVDGEALPSPGPTDGPSDDDIMKAAENADSGAVDAY